MAAFGAPAAAFLASGGSVYPLAQAPAPKPVAEEGPPCCMELVAAAQTALPWAPLPAPDAAGPEATEVVTAASRWRVVDMNVELALPAGVAPESGLQVKTILTARSISAIFPEIQSIGGVRPDSLRWHPNGLALDVMIPNPSSAEGIALGNQIVAFVMKNAKKFGIQDAIWRGAYYTPGGVRNSGMGHYDHVHVTTTGGGFPTGSEMYFR
jgi:hypothetical protein